MRLAPRISCPSAPRMEKPQPWRSESHLAFIRALRICAATGKHGPVDAHHLIHLENPDGTIDLRGGRKRGDDLTVPLEHGIHMQAHASGRPEEWLLETYGLQCRELCQALMRVSGDHEAGRRIIERSLQDALSRLRRTPAMKT